MYDIRLYRRKVFLSLYFIPAMTLFEGYAVQLFKNQAMPNSYRELGELSERSYPTVIMYV